MTSTEAYRDLVERALKEPIEGEDVDAVLESLGSGAYTNDLPDDDDSREAVLDCLHALAEIEPDDAAPSWNLGGTLEAAGRHLEAAAAYRRAATVFEVEVVGLDELPDDDRLFAESSLYHAAKQYAAARRPLCAAILATRLTDAEQRAEVVGLVAA
jgi:tetratricopeptide (TPR) repeat protein